MDGFTRDLVRIALARTVFVATAFGVTLAVYVLAGQAPDRSLFDWAALVSVLSLLALAGGLLAASVDVNEGS